MKGNTGNPLALTSLNHLPLVCTSVEESIDFYKNVLGFVPCESIDEVEMKLREMEIEYVREVVEGGGIYVDQLFFHYPDGFMVEICNCDQLPVIPLVGKIPRSCSTLNILHQPHTYYMFHSKP
ncbi:hypothetical protein HAX54_050265 [Datura stramonium]|uniref:Glyoxalase/fosfomycin resistance/dioxygenase domain-containing protein n=1 Tax=Datura stramonium TaxID=4076 RepID=A0ABS8WL73_DATST|nr:hypothetical protein [Datura stramonium]